MARQPAQPRVSITQETDDVTVFAFPRGQIDGHAVRELYEQVVQIIDHPNACVLIDLDGIEIISSGAMGMCVTLKKKCLGVGAQMHVAVPRAQVMQQFQIMNLHMVLRLFVSRQEAVAAFE